jgi:hypothetical protein
MLEAPTDLASATDKELVELGMELEHGAAATVEAMRRLRVAVEKANASSEQYANRLLRVTRVLVVLTIVLVVLTIVLVVLTALLAVPVIKELF